MKSTRRQFALEKAEEKKLLSEVEGQRTKKKLMEEPLENFHEDNKGKARLVEGGPSQEEEEENLEGDYVTTENLTLLHGSFEAKLFEHQEATERAATQRQQALESKLKDLMNLLSKSSKEDEKDLSHSRSPSPRPLHLAPHTSTIQPRRPSSPTPSEGSKAPLALTNFGNQEVLKALMRQIPDYNGSGGVPKLLEFVDKFKAFREEMELSTTLELQFATSKLTGDALIWWRQHKREFPRSSSERITTFIQLWKALVEQFAPPEYETSIRTKLRALKQTDSVREYNNAFSRLVQQLSTVSFEEVSFDYLQGLQEEVRNLVRTQNRLRTLRDLQLAALRLDPYQYMEEPKLKRNENKVYTVKKDDKDHPKRRGPPRRFPSKAPSELICWSCGRKGHYARSCTELEETLKKFHEAKGNREAQNREAQSQEQAMVAKSTIYLDSGATSHMTNQPEWLEDFEELKEVYMKVGDGSKLAIEGKGLLPLTIKTPDGDVEYDAPNVLYVPGLTDTLLSIGEIAREG